jgi:hypothetical protein
MVYDGGITPTDIDGLIEYDGKCFVFFELKLDDAPLPSGQRKALMRLVDDLSKPSILIIAWHNIEDPSIDIDVALAIVSHYYYGGKWYSPMNMITLKELVDRFLKKHGGERFARYITNGRGPSPE